MEAEPVFTHRVTITLDSNEQDPNVGVRVHWEPDLDGKSIKEIGYIPASFDFVQRYILPALEEAYMQNEYGELMEAKPPSDRMN